MLLCFFFNDPATTEIYTLSLHDALPISASSRLMRLGREIQDAASGLFILSARLPRRRAGRRAGAAARLCGPAPGGRRRPSRSEEHTSELQSRLHLVCRLLLEKKKKKKKQ